MNYNSWLKSIKAIGEYKTDTEIINKLEYLEDSKILQDQRQAKNSSGKKSRIDLFKVRERPWYPATHQYGYIAPFHSGSEANDISHPSSIQSDSNLKNHRINIRLDKLRVYEYPGRGKHNIMITFEALNQTSQVEEAVSFSQTYEVPNANDAAVAGYPIFIGLNVGSQGIEFKGVTINVKNDQDEALLNALKSSTFQKGLKLLTTAQPAIGPFTAISKGLFEFLAKRNKNITVQKFHLGLDFDDGQTGLRLAEGSYVAAQVPSETEIDWGKWVYKPKLGLIGHKEDDSLRLNYNYLVFRVSRYQNES